MQEQREIFKKLKAVLTDELPGQQAQWQMATQGRKQRRFVHKRTAAVLIALYPSNDGWHFPLIKRADDGYVHSGQVGLPGGKIEEGESIIEAAMREAQEEVGLNPQFVNVAGNLTALPIPVSCNLVYPVIGVLEHEPAWNLNPREVQELLLVNVDDLLDENNRMEETWQFSQGPRLVPFFKLQDHKVWGATAMILSEFVELMRRVGE